MDRNWIRQWTDDKIFKRGMEIWKFAGVYGLSYQDLGNNLVYMQAQVQGSYEDVYIVNLVLNGKTMELVRSECECPAFEKYRGYANIVWLFCLRRRRWKLRRF